MSSIVLGSNMILELGPDYTPIGCATNCSFSYSNELIGKTDRNAGLFRKYRVRLGDCTANIQGLTTLVNDETISSFYFLQEAIRRTEQPLRFRFEDESGNLQSIEGNFLVQTISMNSDVSGFAEFDISFQGTGGASLLPVVVDSPAEGVCEVQETLYLTLAESATSVTSALLIGADREILFVTRSGTSYNETTGTPGNLEFKFNNVTGAISWATGNPGNPGGEPVTIGWQIVP